MLLLAVGVNQDDTESTLNRAENASSTSEWFNSILKQKIWVLVGSAPAEMDIYNV